MNFARPDQLNLIKYISNVHMSLSHRGLKRLAKEAGIEIDILDQGNFILFMNTPRNAFKLLAPGNILLYYRHPKNHIIDPAIIPYIPSVFDGKDLNVNKAYLRALKKDFLTK